MGETILGSSFALGPGGKGSNQAVAAARCNANVSFISRLGQDAFAQMALDLYSAESINAHVDHCQIVILARRIFLLMTKLVTTPSLSVQVLRAQ